jgi:hypothetical protein
MIKAIFGVYTVRTGLDRENTLKKQSTIRHPRTPWARRVLGTFVVVCLNMALQPCAMAFGGGENDCVHCPPALIEDGSSHSMHHADDSDSMSTNCATGISQCTVGDDISIDSRTSTIKVKDAPTDSVLAIAPAMPVLALAEYSPLLAQLCIRSYLPGEQPPLNVLYCVYLD